MNSRRSRPDTDDDLATEVLASADTGINTGIPADGVPPQAAVTARPNLAEEAVEPEPPVYIPSTTPENDPDTDPDDDPDGGQAPVPEELPAAAAATDGYLGTVGDSEDAPPEFTGSPVVEEEHRTGGRLRRLLRRG